MLAVAAAAWGAAVVLYRPASPAVVALAALLALGATPAMIAAARFETRGQATSTVDGV